MKKAFLKKILFPILIHIGLGIIFVLVEWNIFGRADMLVYFSLWYVITKFRIIIKLRNVSFLDWFFNSFGIIFSIYILIIIIGKTNYSEIISQMILEIVYIILVLGVNWIIPFLFGSNKGRIFLLENCDLLEMLEFNSN